MDPRKIKFPVWEPEPEPCAWTSLGLAVFINVMSVVLVGVFGFRTSRTSSLGVLMRLLGLFFACVLSTLILRQAGFITIEEIKPYTDYNRKKFVERILYPFGISLTLFAGVMVDRFIDDCLCTMPANWSRMERMRTFVISPILEEYLFRFLVITLLLQCYSAGATVWLSAMLFTLSHAPHYYTAFRRNGVVNWFKFAIHLASTLLFGLYSAILYVRVKSLVSLAIVHAFCNYMQLPRLHRICSNFYVLFVTFVGLIASMMTMIFFVDEGARYRAIYVT